MKKYLVLIFLVLVSTACSLPQTGESVSTIQEGASASELPMDVMNTSSGEEEEAGQPTALVDQNSPNSNSSTNSEMNSLSDASSTEEESLRYMVEEEKLAHDVYEFLYNLWGQRIFTNISTGESRHMEAVRNLLERYGLEDTSLTSEPGQFTIPDIQQLYDQLTAQGSQSLEEALKVGIMIEEVDIADLEQYLDSTTDIAIRQVFDSLLQGSKNHLQAFTRVLEQKNVQAVGAGSPNSGQFNEVEPGSYSNQGIGKRQGRGQGGN